MMAKGGLGVASDGDCRRDGAQVGSSWEVGMEGGDEYYV